MEYFSTRWVGLEQEVVNRVAGLEPRMPKGMKGPTDPCEQVDDEVLDRLDGRVRADRGRGELCWCWPRPRSGRFLGRVLSLADVEG